jgi:hypothetical protein
MPYLTITRFAGDPDDLAERYRGSAAALSAVGCDHGLILHAAGRTEDGFVVVNLWPSRDGSEAAAADPRRRAELAASGVPLDRIRREHHQLDVYELGATPSARSSRATASPT